MGGSSSFDDAASSPRAESRRCGLRRPRFDPVLLFLIYITIHYYTLILLIPIITLAKVPVLRARVRVCWARCSASAPLHGNGRDTGTPSCLPKNTDRSDVCGAIWETGDGQAEAQEEDVSHETPRAIQSHDLFKPHNVLRSSELLGLAHFPDHKLKTHCSHTEWSSPSSGKGPVDPCSKAGGRRVLS